MNNWQKEWHVLYDKTVQLKNAIQTPSNELLKSVPLYWSNDLKKWIDYKEQVLFPKWKSENHPMASVIPTIKREHQLLGIVADRFVFDQSPLTYQSFMKIANSLLTFEKAILFEKLESNS